jgi:hypothetical protein
MYMILGTCNVRSLCRSGTLKTVARELAKYKFHLMGVQEVRWDMGDIEPADYYTFPYGNWNINQHLGTGFFLHKEIISAVEGAEFSRISYAG